MKNQSTTAPKIFGYDWEQIKAAQQGDKSALHRVISSPAADHKSQIIRDMEMHHLPVYKSVADSYGIEMPAGYVLRGDCYRWEA